MSARAELAANAYVDPKRYAWLVSLLVPALAGAGPALYLWSGDAKTLWWPLILVYILMPLLDLLLGEDVNNPPESAVPALEADLYYRLITYALVPMLWAWFIFATWFVTQHALPFSGLIAVTLSTGVIGGFCINVGHELGHKKSTLERWLAKLILAPSAYGHFFVEHNRGHHRDVATHADPASSRMGESIYRFLLREMPGAWIRAWRLESARMRAAKRSPMSWHNDIVQTSVITGALWVALIIWLGWTALPFLLLASFWANFQLTSANYIEHYGIQRLSLPSGRFETCQPHHSWNSNHLVSNWALFHLQRHSDHHAHATRRYQALRTYPSLPQLPTGYFGMFLLSYVPTLFFKVMDPRLLALVGSDLQRINFDPKHKAALIARYQIQEAN